MTSKRPVPLPSSASAQSPRTLDLIRKIRDDEQEEAFREAKEVFTQQVERYEIKGNIAKIIAAAIDYVEELAPKLGVIVGMAFKGPLKMNLLVELVGTVVGATVMAIEKIIDYAEHLIEITINKSKYETSVAVVQTSKESKTVKKKFFRCG